MTKHFTKKENIKCISNLKSNFSTSLNSFFNSKEMLLEPSDRSVAAIMAYASIQIHKS